MVRKALDDDFSFDVFCHYYGVNNYDKYSNKEIAERLCEAYFYLGHWHKLAGNLDKAIYYFKLTSTTGIHEFIEYKYALMELASIQKELLEESTSKIN